MTPKAQRIALAKVDGWELTDKKTRNGHDVYRKGNIIAAVAICGNDMQAGMKWLPEYDLDDLARVEKLLIGDTMLAKYEGQLRRVFLKADKDDYWTPQQRPETCIWHASAEQRREALLKTLNLWTE